MKTNNFPRMHVSLYVRNITETVNFYTAFFGKPAGKVKSGYAKYILEIPSLIISFVENADRVSENFGHLGFQVETIEEMNGMLQKAKSNGIPVLEETGTNCCYALQDKFWVKDPNGVQWEVYYFHQDAEFNDPHYAEEAASACCMPAGVADIPVQKQEKPKIKLSDLQNCCDKESNCC